MGITFEACCSISGKVYFQIYFEAEFIPAFSLTIPGKCATGTRTIILGQRKRETFKNGFSFIYIFPLLSFLSACQFLVRILSSQKDLSNIGI